MPNLKKGFLKKRDERQAGSALYLAIIVLIILLAIVVGLTAILIGQMRMVRQMGYSVIALSAADAGIEEILVTRDSPTTACTSLAPCDLGDAQYYLDIVDFGVGDCTSTEVVWSYCITSVGIYQGVRRAIEVVY